LSRGRASTIAAGWVLAQAPGLLVLSVLGLVDPLVRQDPEWGLRSLWPLPEAVAAGLTLGLVFAFVQAPLTVGVLTAFYRPGPAGEPIAASPAPGPSEPEPLPA
jgi:hypothetical protein